MNRKKALIYSVATIIIISLSTITPILLVEIFGIEGQNSYRKILGLNKREKAIDLTSLYYNNYRLTLTYKGYYITLMPYVIYNGNYFTLEDLVNQNPQIIQNIDIDFLFDDWKFAINITDIPLNRQANINYIGLERIDTNLLGSDIELGNYTICKPNNIGNCINYNVDYILFRNKVKMDYSDVLGKYTYTLNKTHVEFGNITANILNNNLFIDPTITLQTANTENLDDTGVTNQSPNTNYGSDTTISIRNTSSWTGRGYLKFNLEPITQIPNFNNITSAILYLYHDSTSDISLIINITSHYTNNTIWSESIITWNNQPCGTTPVLFNASCNSTWSDSINVTGALGNWFNWNVTSIVQNYNTTDNITSMILTPEFTGIYSGFKGFNTKENSNTTSRPYLNVTYTITGNTTTITTTITSVNTTTYNITTSKTLTTTTLGLGLGDNFQNFLIAIYLILIFTAIILFFDSIDLYDRVMRRTGRR